MDEELIFSTILAQRELVDGAERQTKATRRSQARRAHLAPGLMIDITPDPESPTALSTPQDADDIPLQLPSFEVEEWYDD